MKTSTSLFAKALATENIFVSFEAEAKTATFDVESRTLIIPDWKVSDTLRDMIVAHEVAHALYTPAEGLSSAMNSARERKLNPQGMKACINVIEDARIERLIKEKFPGCRRDFYDGYREVLDIDLFEIKNLDIADMSIVDKINLHFKFGLFNLLSIPLTDAERSIIDRVASVKNFDDVILLANELYEMAADEERKKNNTSMFGNGNGIMTDDMTKRLVKDGDPNKAGRGNMKYEDFPHISYSLPKANSDAAIIPYADILHEANHAMAKCRKNPNRSVSDIDDAINLVNGQLEEYRRSASNTVRELVAQFERRKAAEEIRKERMKPTGTINPDRLHQFKTHDDIFLRNIIRHEGKKHGMVMVIDWSGSMGDCIDGTMRQLLLLTWFCRKAKIPFEVFLYTEMGVFETPELLKKYNKNDYEKSMVAVYGEAHLKSCSGKKDHFLLSNVALRQVFSSSMTDTEFLEMERLLWRYAARFSTEARTNPALAYGICDTFPGIIDMHGTPSCEALLVAHDYIPKFRAATGSDIVDFIFITDGEPTGLGRYGDKQYLPVKSVRVQHLPTGRTLTVSGDARGHLRSLNLDIQYFLVDEIRKLGCVTIGFSIGSMSGLGGFALNRFIRTPNPSTPIDQYEAADKKYNDFYKKENVIPASPALTPGFDEYYIIRPVKPNLTDEDTGLNANNATLTRIRNQFLKSLTGRKCSRVLLTRFIDLIAGRKIDKFKFMG
jgi:hypothetical protein